MNFTMEVYHMTGNILRLSYFYLCQVASLYPSYLMLFHTTPPHPFILQNCVVDMGDLDVFKVKSMVPNSVVSEGSSS